MADTNKPTTPIQAVVGLITETTSLNPVTGSLSFAMNATVESFNGEAVTYQNDTGNIFNNGFPEGFSVIGRERVEEQNYTLVLLTNNTDGLIGTLVDDVFTTVVDDRLSDHKFNFNTSHPVRKFVTKSNNCSTQHYWTDGLNPRRFIDMDALPWKESPNPNNAFKPIQQVGVLDSNKLKVQPNYSIPILKEKVVTNGGTLRKGKYQFIASYANSYGDTYTPWYSLTNGADVHELQVGSTPDAQTSKAVAVHIENLDTTGVWDFFNLAVIETINNVPTPKLIGTFPIEGKEFDYTYSGVEKSLLPLDLIELFQEFQYYDTAQDVTEVDSVLIWDNLIKNEERNFQPIISQVKAYWETHQIPYNDFEGYKNGTNSALYKSWMRDEVYPIEMRLITKSGRRLNNHALIGRQATNDDKVMVANADSASLLTNPCNNPVGKERWEVYNTASIIDFSEEYKNKDEDNNCYKGPYQYGEFAYWESTDKYPNNPDIWGNLANTPIRHFKFPDSLVTHIHDSTSSPFDEQFIYPIGVKIDVASLYNAIQSSDLPQFVKDDIVGYEVSRGNRATNKSIIAKGLFSNVGKYTTKDSKGNTIDEAFYANYPFNDLRPDPFYANKELPNHAGYRPKERLEGFGEHSKSRFTFHSPDTHFSFPALPNNGYMKLETVEYGTSRGHFVPVKDNAQYKFLAKETNLASAGIAAAAAATLGAGTFGTPTVTLEGVIPTFLASKEMFEKIVPFSNFGYSFNSVGYYHKFFAIPNSGYKSRFIQYSTYLRDGEESDGQGNLVNNFRRESSVFINTDESNPIPFTHQFDNSIPEDHSRFTLSSQNPDAYYIDDFLNEFNLQGASYIPVDIIEKQIPLSQTPIDTRTTVKFTVSGLATYAIPEDGDIYIHNGVSYQIESTDIYPINVNSADVVLNTLVLNPPIVLTIPTPGTLDIAFYATPGSASENHITFAFAEITIPPSIIDIRAEIQQRLNYIATLQYDEDGLEALKQGDYIDVLAYEILYAAYEAQYDEKEIILSPEEIRNNNISSYYGSIKANLPNQWGRIYSYEVVSTGHIQNLLDEYGFLNRDTPTVFGGDTFINRFAFKTKLPFYRSNTHNANDQTDIEYDKKGTLGWPMFWLSTKAESLDVDISKEINKILELLNTLPGFKGSGGTLAKIWTTIKGLLTGGASFIAPALQLVIKLFKEIVRTVGIPNINLDNYKKDGILETGIHYLFAYGIPYYFVESQVNTDFRDATNFAEGNFYPNVSKGIPDDWVQESTTSIIHDNSYNYNPTYSFQNSRQVFYSHLRDDYDPFKLCNTQFPNRTIWSEKSSIEETKNHWLIYRPLNKYDFPKSFGSLTSLDGIDNNQVLARFHDRSQLYNVFTTVNISAGAPAYLGNSKLFSAPPLDLSNTDGGFAGSQHSMLLKTPFGHIFTDVKRGQVILYKSGSGVEDLSLKGNDKWFKNHLPFNITKYFDIPTDNSYNSVGITGVYDSLLRRIIITKKDFIPLVDGIIYDNDEFKYNGDTILLNNSTYFCDKSFSISYSFLTNSWVSLHSWVPDYYIQHPTFFQTGYNQSVWNHNKTYTLFNNYYGVLSPYILEYPISTGTEEYLQSVLDYTSAVQFTDVNISRESSALIYFNKGIIYNRTQNTGVLNFVPKKQNSLALFRAFPKYNTSSKDILLDKKDHYYKYNTFWNIVKDDRLPTFVPDCSTLIDKELDESNLDYSRKDYKKELIRNRDVKIRLILDNRDDYRLISRFIIPNTSPSFL